MPLAQISILEGRSPEMIAEMAEKVTAAIVESLGAPPQNVRVVVTQVAPEHWFVAGNSLVARARADAEAAAQRA